jgi:hypothetical protein
MEPNITINITNLIGTMKISGDINNARTQIEEKVKAALLKAVRSVREPLEEYTQESKQTFELNAKEIWSDNETDFNAQIEKLKSETLDQQNLTICKHYIAICFTSS